MIQGLRFAPRCVLILCSFFLVPFSLARGALDPETDKPYRLQVVLRIAENRLLTPLFRDLVQRQLRYSLQAALGDLAKVEIVREHPLLKEVEAKGLQLALNSYSAISDTKTHFVFIDFVNGRYEIQTRQHDGFTGLASPVVRHSSTADRQLVARSAALLIHLDFGLAGTLLDVDRIEGKMVIVKLKGGGLGAPLGHWVQKDQVFAVTQITKGGSQQRSFRMPETLLQVVEEPRGDSCRCRLLHRKKDPLPSAAVVLGYRCLKLGTTQAPLRMRVVTDDRLPTPVNGVQVLISARGFDASVRERTSTKPDGVVKSELTYENVAFVQIYDRENPLAQVPVEIVEDLTITCPVHIGAETRAQGELLHRRSRWVRHLNDGLAVAGNVVKELNAMGGQSSESALDRAQEGLKAIQTDISNLTDERDGIRAEAKELPRATLELKEGEEGLQELQKRRDELQQYIDTVQRIIAQEKDPKRQKWKEMEAQADLQEGEAEFEKAIKLYQQVLAEGGDNPRVQQKLDALKRAWKPKNDAHEKARAFIYETWPKLETSAQIKARLEEARKAFLTCKEAGDILSPRKLLKAYGTHTALLDKEAGALQPEVKEDDRKTANTIIALTDELREFNREVREYLRNAKLPGK